MKNYEWGIILKSTKILSTVHMLLQLREQKLKEQVNL